MKYINYINDHPEIQWIEKTGYPSWMQELDIEKINEIKEIICDNEYEERINKIFEKE